jgi:hypothetical protein
MLSGAEKLQLAWVARLDDVDQKPVTFVPNMAFQKSSPFPLQSVHVMARRKGLMIAW